MSTYAILGPDGLLQAQAPSLEEAVEDAYSSGAQEVIIDAADDEGRDTNPAPGPRQALQALRLSNRDEPLFISDNALDMSKGGLREAQERLSAIMPPYEEHTKKGIKIKHPARDVGPLVKSFLGQNAKLEKKAGHGHDVDVQGLALVPFWLFARDGLDRRQALPNLCVGSSSACRHSCLVYSGQNWASSWSIASKFQKTNALFQDPEAFGRMLHRRCYNFWKSSTKKGVIPMVRLNVLSDIVWEHVFPSLFESLPDLQFYDYTKIAHRYEEAGFPDNYDLTFSNSGTNLQDVYGALNRGMRIATVVHIPEWEFGPAKRGLSKKKTPDYAQLQDAEKKRLWSKRLPVECDGYRVIDGDINDVRALDKSPLIVALRWKRPGGQASSKADSARKISRDTKFIVEVQDMCGMFVGAVTPSEQPDAGPEDYIESVVPLMANPGMVSLRTGPGKKRTLAVSRRSNTADGAKRLKAKLLR